MNDPRVKTLTLAVLAWALYVNNSGTDWTLVNRFSTAQECAKAGAGAATAPSTRCIEEVPVWRLGSRLRLPGRTAPWVMSKGSFTTKELCEEVIAKIGVTVKGQEVECLADWGVVSQ